MEIVLVTTVIASLFLVIGAAEPLAARLRLPYSVILAVLGVLIGAGAIFFLRTELTDALNPVAEAILGLPIRSNVFLYVFLPTLLFQATLGMNLRRMLDDWVLPDQFQPVSTRAGWLSFMPRKDRATRREQRRGSA